MKLLAYLFIGLTVYAANELKAPKGIISEGAIGIGSSVINSQAILDVVSTTKAFLPPRMSTGQRDAMGTPPEGAIIHNTSTHFPTYYSGTGWVELATGSSVGSPTDYLILNSTATPGGSTTAGTIRNHGSTGYPVIFNSHFGNWMPMGATVLGTCSYAQTPGCNWNTGNTGGNPTAFAANASCPSISLSGKGRDPGSKIPACTFNVMPAGTYLVFARGTYCIQTTSVQADMTFSIFDGVADGGGTYVNASGVAGQNEGCASLIQAVFNYSATQTNKTLQVRGRSSSDSNDPNVYNANDLTTFGFEITVIYFPGF